MEVREFSLFVPGPPQPRREPDVQIRARKGGQAGLPPGAVRWSHLYPHFHPKDTQEKALAAWRRAWLDHPQRPYVPGFIGVRVTAWVNPGPTQRREGAPYPRRPDADNVLKLVLDALKERAFDDDAHVAVTEAAKAWATIREPEGVRLEVWALDKPAQSGLF